MSADAAAPAAEPKSFLELSAPDAKKQVIDFSQYKGKVVLVVNVASKCGFTPQYAGLEKLYKENKDAGLVILGFPCNSFMSQEPASEEEILGFCSNTYGVTFPIMQKIEVNGDKASPVYKFLKSQKSGMLGIKMIKVRHTETAAAVDERSLHSLCALFLTRVALLVAPLRQWNFEKFLVNRKGEVVERFGSTTKPEEIAPKIKALLDAPAE